MNYIDDLINWYQINKRMLPFRQSRDAYSIWVSEIMAQQTRIDTMLEYYSKWMAKWPTVDDLAKAQIEEVLKMWQGLGYYNRARKLHEGAKIIVEQYHSIVPDTLEELLKVPGIGPYTAGAIASIAYENPSPAVDGNVLRVVTRFFCIEKDITSKKTVDEVYQHVLEWMKEAKPSDLTQALMELGALVCTPLNADCSNCPFNKSCRSYQNNCVEQLPIKKKAKKPLEIDYSVYLCIRDNKILLSDNWSDGLMKGYYRLPMVTEKTSDFVVGSEIGKMKHVFSHRIWNMSVYMAYYSGTDDSYFWCDFDKLKEMNLVTATVKILEKEGLL